MKITIRPSILAIACLALSAAAPSKATTVVYGLTLTGAKEAPTNASLGTGSATITIDDVLNTMRVQLSFANLSGNTTAMHIHCCTVVPVTGTSGVATTTPSFVGFLTGVKFGTMDQTYDMNLAGSFNAAFITANGGTTAGAFTALKSGLDSGRAYLNIHTAAFPGGEIRSFATVSAVPEPGTWALMLGGLTALGTVAGRRRQA